ncbi:hypothetical protein GJ496_009018 [Pomphorhynchus laevis]|nr:hypothetical protein GJ496_009018 [Pomphorhynchus laevis]
MDRSLDRRSLMNLGIWLCVLPLETVVPVPSICISELVTQRSSKVKYCRFSLKSNIMVSSNTATFSEFTQRIPEKLLRTMNKPGMKPFTYTPRGVDLDEIMEKARKRQISRQMKMIEQYADPRQQEQTMRNVPRTKTVQQMSSAFTGDTYAAPVQQSRSFHKLTGWVNENASKQYGVQSPNIHNTSTVAVTINNDATLPYHTPQNIPSNESICSRRPNTVRRSFDPVPSYTSFQDVTAHDRDREPEAQKYQGSNIPSRSFRMLQEFTHANNNSGLDHSSRMKTDGSNRSTTYEHKATADTVPSRSFRYLQQMSGNSSSDESSFSKYATPNQSISKVQASTALYSTDF